MVGIVSKTDAAAWVDVLVVLLPPLRTLIGAWVARQKVKPDLTKPETLPTPLIDRTFIAAVLQAAVLLGLTTQSQADAWVESLGAFLLPLLTILGAILSGQVTDKVYDNSGGPSLGNSISMYRGKEAGGLWIGARRSAKF